MFNFKGLDFIHTNNFVNCHGRFTSRCCLVDERWVVKISDYGLGCFFCEETLESKSKFF